MASYRSVAGLFTVPRDASFIWLLSFVVLRLYQRFFYRIRVQGLHHIPAHGPVVLAANHASGHDIIVLGCTSPRQIHFMAKKELFAKNRLMAAYFSKAGVFPVDRGGHDRRAIATALGYLRAGRVLGMFPEGTRRGTLTKGKTGAARLALKTEASVVPVAIIGTSQIKLRARLWRWRRDRVTIQYGPPISVSDAGQAQPDAYELAQRLTDEVMRAIARMLPPDMRGVYAET